MTFRSILVAGTILLGIAGQPLRAAEVTPEQRAALEGLVRSWYTLGGKTVTAGADAISVTPAGDHFDVVAPMRLLGPARGETKVTAAAQPRDEGRWHFENIRLGLPFVITTMVPKPAAEGSKAPAQPTPYTFTINAQGQDGSADWDPSFKTPVRSVSNVTGMTLHREGGGIAQESTVASARSDLRIDPASPDAARVNGSTQTEITDYALVTKPEAPKPDDAPIAFAAHRITLSGSARELDRAQFGKLLATLSAIGEQVPQAGAPKGAKTPIPPALREQLAASLQGLASQLGLNEDMEQVKLGLGTMEFAFDKARIAFDGSSSDGLVRASAELGYDGFKMPDLGTGFEELAPRRLVLKPFIRDMAAPGFNQVLTTAMSGADPKPGDIAPLFARGPVVAGVEELALDMAGTVFTGSGAYTMTSPTEGAGTAHIVAENIDALIQTLNRQPTTQQGVPALVFLKGIGRNEGGKLVWDIAYAGRKLTVNGLDMTALTGGAPKGPAPRR